MKQMNLKKYCEFSKEVQNALEHGTPIVAIETGGTFEGLPYPQNVKTALEVEAIIRENGATPAYVSIMNGKIMVGMDDEKIEAYGKLRGTMPKASKREIPLLLAQEKNGVMTLAATMFIASEIGISVVVGGGMGGVHRGAEDTMDISSDLEEIALSDVIVVCSGAKSILDLNLTMEYLETKSIPVIGYQTDELPAYMAKTSGIKVPCRMDKIEDMAKAYQIKKDLNIKTGMLFLNPIADAYAVDAEEMNAAINVAIEESIQENITGKAITGFLMKRVKEQMGADSIDAQIEMLKGNARVGAELSSLCK